jgi:hypothetical protein
MPLWGWILVALGAVLLLSVAIGAMMTKRRTAHLKDKFGPEYDRTVEDSSNRREAESELTERERRRRELDIRPLSPAARDRYAERWQTLQAEFVDAPTPTVAAADSLVTEVMRERGYPMDDFEQRAADVSVDHPVVVESYREAHRLAERSAEGEASTEDERQALRHYRRLFDELLGTPADEPTSRERESTDADVGASRR